MIPVAELRNQWCNPETRQHKLQIPGPQSWNILGRPKIHWRKVRNPGILTHSALGQYFQVTGLDFVFFAPRCNFHVLAKLDIRACLKIIGGFKKFDGFPSFSLLKLSFWCFTPHFQTYHSIISTSRVAAFTGSAVVRRREPHASHAFRSLSRLVRPSPEDSSETFFDIHRMDVGTPKFWRFQHGCTPKNLQYAGKSLQKKWMIPSGDD